MLGVPETSPGSVLLDRLRAEKAERIKGGIYHRLQIDLTYSSNRIEGSRLSEEQTRLIFETRTIDISEGPVRVDDVVETSNHFRAVDAVIDHAGEPLTENMIKCLHRVLKTATPPRSGSPWVTTSASPTRSPGCRPLRPRMSPRRSRLS